MSHAARHRPATCTGPGSSSVDTDGPFLSVPVLKQAWPHGHAAPDEPRLDALRDAKPAFEKAWDAGCRPRRQTADSKHATRVARDAWVETWSLRDGRSAGRDFYVSSAIGRCEGPLARLRGHRQPDRRADARGDTTGALVLVVDPVDSLRDPLDDGWAASPVDRMEELLRNSGVRIGVVTDGRWWAVVSARPETDGRLRHRRRADLDRRARRPRRVPAAARASPASVGRPERATCSPSCSRSRSPPPRRSPRRWARRSAARSNCWSRRCPRRALDAAAPRRAGPAARPTATRSTRPPSP